jgi:hypothetical protein
MLKFVMKNLDEVKDSIRRVHERLDEIYKQGMITRAECENYRRNCPACQDVKEFATKEDLKAVKGYPAWIVVLFSVSSSLVVFVATLGFFLAKK